MFDEMIDSVNTGEVAEPQTETESQETQVLSENNSEVATPKPVQSDEENSKYAAARREAERKFKDRQDNFAKKLGHNSFEELESRLAEEEAAEQAAKHNLTPEVYKKLTDMEQKLMTYEQKEKYSAQDKQLSNDPKYGELYKQWRNDVQDLATKFNVDLDAAFTLVAREKLPELLAQKPNIEELKKQAIKEYIEEIKTGKKPVEGSGASPVIKTESPKTFDDARKNALAFLRAQKQ